MTATLGLALARITTVLWVWQRHRSEALSTPSLPYAKEVRSRRALETRRATL